MDKEKEYRNTDNEQNDEQEQMQNIIGLGKFSARKSYYPELQKKIAELEKEKRKYERIFSDALSGIFQVNFDGEIIVANSAMVKLCGYDSEEDFLSIKDVGTQLFISLEKKDAFVNELKGNDSVIGFETQFFKKNKSIIDVSLNATLQHTPDEEYVEFFVQDITDRKIAERQKESALIALQESEDRIRRIMENSPDMIYRMSLPEGKYEYVSPVSVEVFGYTAQEFYDNPTLIRKIIHPGWVSYFEKEWEKLLKGNMPPIYEYQIIHKDGTVKWCNQRNMLLKDAEGKPKVIEGIVTDITDRKEIEEALKKSEHKYRQLIDQSNDAIYLLYDGKFEIINKSFERMFGYDQEETRHDDFNFIKLVSSKSMDIINERIQKSKDGEQLDSVYEFKAVHKNGMELDCEVSVSYINFKEGTATQGVIRDITQRRKAEEEVRKLSRAVQQSPVGVLITDSKGNIEYVNPKFELMTGYILEEVIGKNPKILKSGYQAKEFYQDLWETILAGKNWQGELLNRKKDGEYYWENQTISPLVNDDGKITSFVSMKEDITEKKKMIEDLIKAKEKAEHSDQLKSEFLAQISHEIRTPLNSIMSYTNLLKDELYSAESDELDEIFSSISNSVTRIIRTIDLILNASELQANSYDLSLRNIDLFYDVILKVYNDLKHAAELKHLELVIENNTDASILNCDEYSVYQTVVNLVDNAIKYTENGKVIVRLYRNDYNLLIIDVEDTGIGISEEYIESLYDPFSQEEAGYTRRFEGTGLGLALVKKYCELNSIEISVYSKKGEGTKFTLVFNEF